MKIIALEVEKEGLAKTDFGAYLKQEAAAVWNLQQRNILREIYFNQNTHTAVLVLETNSTRQALEILNELPLVQAGLIDFELIPLVPYDGFSRLFKNREE
ncbi:MAG: hypothetical protein GYA18_05790 [Chloroflexi bacterium]|nr:hypothetical protein [Chloroflexota bacterium]